MSACFTRNHESQQTFSNQTSNAAPKMSGAHFTDNRAEMLQLKEAQKLAGTNTPHQQMMQLRQLAKNGTHQPVQKRNNTGLPDPLKSGMENLSGMSLDHVRVHYNSPRPAAVQAHAYAQGNDIHLASGQEKHLPHELGHVVQQAQGRVKPTTQINGMLVNDNPGLEKEADVMGTKALSK